MSIFKFKQFDVDQSGCAMKINTDGVLLAALVADTEPKHILDIGTGTGVLALMMAQRFPDAIIEAIEIDEDASATADQNFSASVFADRLSINNRAIEVYDNETQFDLILTNPPFFVNDLKNPEAKKGIARHADHAFFNVLVDKVNGLLANEGHFWFILPIKQAEWLMERAKFYGLKASKVIQLHSDKSKPAFRWIVCLQRKEMQIVIEHFYIYESEKVYTEAYRELLKGFFLGY